MGRRNIGRINFRVKAIENTGIGANSNMYGDRWFNKNGQPNLVKHGVTFSEKWSLYHTMLGMPRWKFLLLIFVFFIVINLGFAGIYLLIGLDQMSGLTETSPIEKFLEAFFFSAQTFTTVGYGRLSPSGVAFSFVAAIEAFCGLLSLALATGLVYGRFAQPKGYLKYSKNAIIAPFKNGIALMLRIAPYKNTTYTDVTAKLTIGFMVEENGKKFNRFYALPLEYETVNALTLSWTLVHPINEASPLFGLSLDDLKLAKAEILVFIKAFDDAYSSTIVSRSSYVADEIIEGVRFEPMYHRSEDGETTILDLNRLNSFAKADAADGTPIILASVKNGISAE